MLLKKESFEDGCSIGIWEVEESVSELSEILENADIYNEKLSVFSNEKRKKEWIAVRLLVNLLCGENKIICYNENGKPFLKDNSFQISISHTKGTVAVIVHPTKEVGIDVEKISNKIIGLQHKFLNNIEIQDIDKQNETFHLLLYWCAKEVIYKMINQNGVDFSNHLHISAFEPKLQGQFSGKETKSEKQENFTFEYRIKKDFILVWSVKQ